MKKGKTLEQIKEQKEKNRARMRIVYLILALVLLLAGGYVLVTRYFVINEIIIPESEYYSAEDIIATSGLRVGDSLFTCNDRKVENRVFTLHPYISKIDVKKRFPDKIEFVLEEQDGVMYVPVLHENYALSRDMKVLGRIKNDENKIKLVTKSVKRCIVGEMVKLADEDEYELIKRLYSELEETGMSDKITLIDVRDRFNICFNYDNRFNVYIGDDELLDYKTKIFEKVIVDFPQDSGRITINENGRAVINFDEY